MAKGKPKKQAADDQPSTSNFATRENGDSRIWQDSRFNSLLADPRFRQLPKTQRKVKIDKRFQSMFTDQKFKIKYTVDKYGRRVNHSNSEDLKKYYELDSDAEESGEDEEVESKASESSDSENEEAEVDVEGEQRKEEKAIIRETDDQECDLGVESDNDALGSDSEEDGKPLGGKLFDPKIDYARGEGRVITDSSSDEESTEDEDDPDVNIAHTWGELDAEAERTDESTNRLAVCNMDWDRIRALDLMVLFSSFLPPGGTILSVKIFMSEFGKERLKIEEEQGPAELVGLGKEVNSQNGNSDDDDSDNNSEDDGVQAQDSEAEEGDDYHMEKLRQYQLNRLRYYYAVVECDNVSTADKIYTECDGIEYESSANRIDLRFIPDDTTFDDEPTDECKELPEGNNYQPRLFTNTALQQAKVELTWDETAVERRELGDRLASGKLEEVDDKDLRKIVAYSSEEESDSDGAPETTVEVANHADKQSGKSQKFKKDDYINKYKALLAEINEKEQQEKNKKFGVEVSWTVDEQGNAEESERESEDEEKPNSELTPIQKVLKKRSEKNKKRKIERKKNKLLAQGIDPDVAGNNIDSDSAPDDIDMNDPYFAEEFANGDFVDPKDKKREKLKKQKETQALLDEEAEKQAKELELLLEDDDDGKQGKQHFSLEKILKSEQDPKSKRKRRKLLKKSKADIAAQNKVVEDNFKLNLDDNRFKAMYTSSLYNIDPTHSHFKKTKGMEDIINEKLKRKYGVGINGESALANEVLEPESKKPKKKLEQTLLVKSLKRKLQANQQ